MIGERIKARRSDFGMSLSELARRTGISRGYLHLVENGQSMPSAEKVQRIATELDMDAGGLILATQIPLDAREFPDSLNDFADLEGLPNIDVQMLAGIHYRGRQPETIEDWRFIYEAIKRTLSQGGAS